MFALALRRLKLITIASGPVDVKRKLALLTELTRLQPARPEAATALRDLATALP